MNKLESLPNYWTYQILDDIMEDYIYHKLEKFLFSLGVPFIASLRDTVEYVRANENGVGIFEMKKANRQGPG